MKKFVKIMLILTLVLVVGGIGFTTAGVAMGATTESVNFLRHMKNRLEHMGRESVTAVTHKWDDDWDEDDWDEDDWDEDDWNGEHASAKVLESSGEDASRVYELEHVEELELSLRYDDLSMEPYEGSVVRVEIYDDPEEAVRVHTNEDGVEIESNSRAEEGRVIQVFYPQDSRFRKLDIEVEEGTVTMGAVEADELDVSVGAGTFDGLEKIVAREAGFSVGTGALTVEALTADSVEGECGMGEMNLTLDGAQTDWNAQLECKAGEILLGEDSYSALGMEKSIRNEGAKKYLELECGAGSVEVDFAA